MKWNLDTIYPSTKEAEAELIEIEALFSSEGEIKDRILDLQEGAKRFKQLDAYSECRLAEDVASKEAQSLRPRVDSLGGLKERALFLLGLELKELTDEVFAGLIALLPELSFFLQEKRKHAHLKGDPQFEQVVCDLSPDGFHSFFSIYQTLSGRLKIGKDELSVGKAYNLLSHPDRDVRRQTFSDWNGAWEEQSDVLAQILNSLAGFRLQVYQGREWDEVLFEPLMIGRMDQATLDAMYEAVDTALPKLGLYLEEKARRLGVNQLSWFDVEAPLPKRGGSEAISWDKGCALILDAFAQFSPEMAAFAQKALDEKWIEAEDRKGKAAGGFCVGLPKTRQSRIFMTYQGTPINVATLAHELGHAYHNTCTDRLPYFCQQIPMNLAETASTFAEMVVIDHLIQTCSDLDEKRLLLDDKLQRAVAYFMNLRSRIEFEKAFYAERKKGFVPPDRLCDLMIEAQKGAYCNALADWDPWFWASKLHFFFTGVPFYNFPYTFGYLLSSVLYQRRGELKGGIEAFLADTGQMGVDELIRKHLGEDCTDPSFWAIPIKSLSNDVDQFLLP